MQHAGTLAYTGHKSTCHRTVRQGSGEKEAEVSGGGFEESTEKDFDACGGPLENVTEFKYLGRVLTTGDYDWPAVLGNLCKARKSWGRWLWILSREGADMKVSFFFPKQ